MSDYIETKTSSDYVLKYLRKFQVPMIRESNNPKSKEIIREIDSIQDTLTALKSKLENFTKESHN
jgi:hypothetical protein